ncbi:MAG: alpha/beta hydrolase, partial [Steroidobacteraceae bacterium]
GQCRGGYLVVDSAFTDPDLFWGRIASNPSFDPGRSLFFAKPAASTQGDLGLVVTSGERDRASGRSDALEWFRAWDGRTDAPWEVKTLSIDGGTHAADVTNSYRAGIVWLFSSRR